MASEAAFRTHVKLPCRSPFDLPAGVDSPSGWGMKGLKLEELPGFRSRDPAESPQNHRLDRLARPVRGIAEDGYKSLEDIWEKTWSSSQVDRTGDGVGLGSGENTKFHVGSGAWRAGSVLKVLLGLFRRWLGSPIEEIEDPEDDSDATEDEDDAEDDRYEGLLEEYVAEREGSLEALPGFHSDGLSSRVYSGVAEGGSLAVTTRSRTLSCALSIGNSSAKLDEQARLASEGFCCLASAETVDPASSQSIGASWKRDAELSSSPPNTPFLDCTSEAIVSTQGIGNGVEFSTPEGPAKDLQSVESATAVETVVRECALGNIRSHNLRRISSQMQREGNDGMLRSASEYELVTKIWDESWHGARLEEEKATHLLSKGFRKVGLFVKNFVRLSILKVFSKKSDSMNSRLSTDDRPFVPAPLHSVYSIKY